MLLLITVLAALIAAVVVVAAAVVVVVVAAAAAAAVSGSWCWRLGVYGGGRVVVAGLVIFGCFWLEHLVATWQTHVQIFFCVDDVAHRQALWAEDLGEHRGQAWKVPAIL